jgi:hypothetical protein
MTVPPPFADCVKVEVPCRGIRLRKTTCDQFRENFFESKESQTKHASGDFWRNVSG